MEKTKLSNFCGCGEVPGGAAVAVFGDDEAEPFEAFEVFGDVGQSLLSGATFELGGEKSAKRVDSDFSLLKT
ncbi:hypothetical protein HC928_17640 [bacterium]|nr:hypothetical protein [bacterium]